MACFIIQMLQFEKHRHTHPTTDFDWMYWILLVFGSI